MYIIDDPEYKHQAVISKEKIGVAIVNNDLTILKGL